MTQGSTPEKPRYEPEIIRPGESMDAHSRGTWRIWRFEGGRGYRSHRLRVVRLGPFGLLALALAAGTAAVLLIVFVLGVFLLWLPVVGLIVAVAILSNLWRGRFPRSR